MVYYCKSISPGIIFRTQIFFAKLNVPFSISADFPFQFDNHILYRIEFNDLVEDKFMLSIPHIIPMWMARRHTGNIDT